MLRKIYGEIILRKDSILYHISDEPFIYKKENEKPFLFCNFHPSEYGMIGDFVTRIKLKKDVSLFFMIESFKKAKIYSALSNLRDHPNKNLAKKHISELFIFSKYLKKENFDGWFTSIENKGTVEAALLNNKNIFEILDLTDFKNTISREMCSKLEEGQGRFSEPFINNWRNGNISNNELNIKNWGKKYSVCTVSFNAILNINERYKEMIKKYIDFEIDSKFINQYVFQMILKNAIITYHKYDYQKFEIN